MKRLLLILTILAVGAVLGGAVAVLRTRAVPWQGFTTGGPNDPHLSSRPASGVGLPKVSVPIKDFDFGAMDMDREGRHEFTFTNVGLGVLRLSKGPTSCGCTLSQVDQTEILPGLSAKVAVQWKAKRTPGEYRETATILTNDPAQERVVLSVSGRMVPAIEVLPPEVSLGQLAVSQTVSGEVRLFGFRAEPLAILGFEATDQGSADRFSVAFHPLPLAEIRERPDAQSGFRVEITAKSGLPLGAIRQTIRLKTSYRDRPPIDVPVEGMVTSDISVFGDGWNAETNVLNLGTISGRTGVKQNVVIVARGPRSKQVNFKLVEAGPRLLKVQLGKTLRMKDRPVAQAILTVEVPPNTPPANFIGSGDASMGRIVIETNHPEVPRLRILVSFLVEG
jgi:hypothetical protein